LLHGPAGIVPIRLQILGFRLRYSSAVTPVATRETETDSACRQGFAGKSRNLSKNRGKKRTRGSFCLPRGDNTNASRDVDSQASRKSNSGSRENVQYHASVRLCFGVRNRSFEHRKRQRLPLCTQPILLSAGGVVSADLPSPRGIVSAHLPSPRPHLPAGLRNACLHSSGLRTSGLHASGL
jgi:hypothetical protein